MASNPDLVIRGGSIADGLGGELFEADVAVSDGRISEVGKVAAKGKEEIDARGKLVTPGFVDVHTHYDGQVTWSQDITPSSQNGVTTAITTRVVPARGRDDERGERSNGSNMSALSHIRQIDYTVIFTRDMRAMREFYQSVMEFPLLRTLGDSWIEFGVGSNTMALRTYGPPFNDTPPPSGALSMQMAFRVPPAEVAKCASALEAKGVKMIAPVTDHQFGHRTVFFRDPDGNVLEIYAEI